uniref:Carotenoid biosynthesis protein n=1 Tax=Gracilinema caldarium TaxID=215591 RepID=A0A7C3ELI6_9SPIR
MKVKNRLFPNSEVLFLAILGIFFFVGFIGHLLPLTRPLMLFLTPYLLLLCGLIVLGVSLKEQGWTLLLWAIPTFLITFALEAVGVATGLIFGAYQYGPVLGSHLWGVPPIIGFNWVLVVLGIARFVRKQLQVRHPALGALLVSLLCVLFDVILEPLAIRLNYWTWEMVQVPLQNYVAWFLISYIFALPTWLFKREEKSILLQGYIAIQGLFFILVRLGLAFMP